MTLSNPLLSEETPDPLDKDATSTRERDGEAADGQTLSKHQRKKQLKEARIAEWRLRRQELRKAKKQRRKLRRREEGAALKEEGEGKGGESRSAKRRRQLSKEEFLVACGKGPIVLIDCGFEGMQTERELISATQQLMFLYGANRKAQTTPFRIAICGVYQDFRNHLNRFAGIGDWLGCEITGLSCIDFIEQVLQGGAKDSSQQQRFLAAEWVDKYAGNKPHTRDDVYYLTADASEVLKGLENDAIYIIGGLVDRNRYPKFTLNRAEHDWEVKSVKLPIKERCPALVGSKVLTVNQVFEIILSQKESESWEEAFDRILPSRKKQRIDKTSQQDDPNALKCPVDDNAAAKITLTADTTL